MVGGRRRRWHRASLLALHRVQEALHRWQCIAIRLQSSARNGKLAAENGDANRAVQATSSVASLLPASASLCKLARSPAGEAMLPIASPPPLSFDRS